MSAAIHLVAIILLIKFGAFKSVELTDENKKHETLTWIAPEPVTTPPPPPVVKIAPPPRQMLAELRKPEILPPPPEPKPELPKIEPPKVEPPKVEPAAPKVAAPVFESRAEVAKVEPEKKAVQPTNFDSAPARETKTLKREVADAGFAAGSSAVPTIKAKANQVQTGGFGDPNGVPAQNSPNKGGAKIAALGSFDLPQGPGYGNGTGGAHGQRGVIADTGFGNGSAQGGVGPGSGRGRGQVASAGFGNAADTAAPVARTVAAVEKPRTTPVEILEKPKPIYTAEARQLKVEGDVLLEVAFGADGQLHVLRVVRGLGHGLDESAQTAAQRIKFKPATRDGQATDSTAMVHIIFELAE